MRHIISKVFSLALLVFPMLSMAQERQTGDTSDYRTLIPEEKQRLLSRMNMIANMQFAQRNEFVDGEYTGSRFKNEQFRLEIRGMVHDKVYFRFRDRYTRAQTSESIDNISRSVDLAYIRVDATDRLSISAGKMCADWGGFEFDYNPIDIYEYSDIIEYADNFLTGVGVSYKVNKNHSFTVQGLDSRTKSFDELYGNQPNFTESKAPLAFVANWRGSLFGDKVKTIWSYSLFNEAEGANMSYIALGTELTLGKFVVAYDYQWSDEELDRTHIVSDIVPDSLYAYALANTNYVGHWVHLHYRVSPKINLSFIAMLDIETWQNEHNDPLNVNGEENIRNAYGYIPTIEYYPFKDYNLKFFVTYIARMYDYSDYATERFGTADYNTSRISIGFISPVGIF